MEKTDRENEGYMPSFNWQGESLDIVYEKGCCVLSGTVDEISDIFAGWHNPPVWGRKCKRSDYKFKSLVNTINFSMSFTQILIPQKVFQPTLHKW